MKNLKASAYDVLMDLTKTGQAKIVLTDEGADAIRPYLEAIRKEKVGISVVSTKEITFRESEE